jgi:hypothetical protein
MVSVLILFMLFSYHLRKYICSCDDLGIGGIGDGFCIFIFNLWPYGRRIATWRFFPTAWDGAFFLAAPQAPPLVPFRPILATFDVSGTRYCGHVHAMLYRYNIFVGRKQKENPTPMGH